MRKRILKSPHQGGVVLPMFAMIIASILGLASLVYYRSTQSLLEADLQSAADAAAIGATHHFCSSKKCYDDSVTVARQLLAQYSSTEGGSFNTLEHDPINREGTLWEIPENNLRVKIERGFVVKNPEGNDPAYLFTSLEGDWEAQNPGLPPYVIANSFRIELERVDVTSLFRVTGVDILPGVSVTSQALAAPVDETEIAPIAIPVCSLISAKTDYGAENDYDFNKESLCLGSRFVTGANRYCPDEDENGIADDPECGIRPAVKYDSCLDDDVVYVSANGREFRKKCNDDLNGNASTVYSDTQATSSEGGWGQYGYANQADHFFVFGLPNKNQVNPNEVLLAFGGEGVVETKIGDPFAILPQGLESDLFPDDPMAVEEILWRKITNNGVASVNEEENFNNDHPLPSDPTVGMFPLPDVTYESRSNKQTNAHIFADNADRWCLNEPGEDPNLPGAAGKADCKTPYQNVRDRAIFDDDPNQSSINSYNYYMASGRHTISQGWCSSRRVDLGCRNPDGTFVSVEDEANRNCGVNFTGGFHPESEQTYGAGSTDAMQLSIWNEMGRVSRNQLVPQLDSSGTDQSQLPIWRVKAAVIADVGPNAQPCEGEGSYREPPIVMPQAGRPDTEGHNWQVIGFLRLLVSDLSFQPPPRDPTNAERPRQAPFDQGFWNEECSIDPNYCGNSPIPLSECGIPGFPMTGIDSRMGGYDATCGPDAVNPFHEPYLSHYPPKNVDAYGAWGVVLTGLPATDKYDVWSGDEVDAARAEGTLRGPNPWHFQLDFEQTSCDMLQTRIYCNSEYIPSRYNDDLDPRRVPFIIE